MSDYDVVVIGGGIGGTAAGAILASNGLKTLLVEKNEFIGGRCSTYEKEGFKIDVGVHSFGRTSKGPLGNVLNMIGMEDAVEWVLARSPGPLWYHQGKFWKFPRDLEKLVPDSDFSSLTKLFSDIMQLQETKELDTISIKSWLSRYTDNTVVHSFFNTVCGLYFVVPYYEASAGEFVRCLASLSRDLSTGYPKGGCISIPLAYTQGIEKFGGDVKTGVSAKKIVVDDEKVQGVELDSGEFVSSKLVISNAGIRDTVNNMVGRNYFNENYLEKTDKLKYSMSALTLKVALEEPITHFKMVSSFSLEDPEEKFKRILEGKVPDEVDLFCPVPSNYDPSLAPKGTQLIIAGTAAPLESFDKNREKWINNSMKSLENMFPGLSDNLMWLDVTTPKDIEILGGKEAAVIGVSQTVDQSGVNRPSSTLPIEGLYLVGGDAGGWGIGTELAAKSAIECSEIILRKTKKAKI
ncbi:MAG: phytoene desaturase family protein [Candidatus Lokiarchaeia archaeon]